MCNVRSCRGRQILVLVFPVMLCGCYTKHYAVSGSPLIPASPAVKISAPLGRSVGIVVNPDSNASDAASVSVTDCTDLFARRLTELQLFGAAVYPFTDLSQADPEVILDITVSSRDQLHWAENIAQAIATGATLLLLQPVLPMRFTIELRITLDGSTRDGQLIATYTYDDSYEFKSTWLARSALSAAERPIR